jgi:glycosyltransferase involved in cell wall biosynthesis
LTTIGIDYTAAYEQGGGIGRYVRELTAALFQLPQTEREYRLFVAGASSPPGHLQSVPTVVDYQWKATPLSTKWLARIWHRAQLPVPVEIFTGPLDLYHSTDFVLPPTHPQTRTVLTVHDLSFLRAPETASPRLQRYLSRVVPHSVERADHILADSVATRDDLIALYNTPLDKITVLLSGVHQGFRRVESVAQHAAIRAKYGIDERPYIFSIGTVQPRKNYGRLVEATAALRREGYDVQVVIAGGRGWLEDAIYQALDTFNMRDHVRFIGYVDDADLPALYSAATCTSFVSLYEGFGLPILESMACGTPVVTSNVSSLPEVAGGAALMVDPTNVPELVAALCEVIENNTTRSTLQMRGYDQVKQFTWEQAAKQLVTTYDRVLEW